MSKILKVILSLLCVAVVLLSFSACSIEDLPSGVENTTIEDLTTKKEESTTKNEQTTTELETTTAEETTPVEEETTKVEEETTKVEEETTPHSHNYVFSEIVWENTTAKAVYVCTDDASHITSYDCEITSEITKVANCTTKGEKTYTATYDGHTSTKTEEIAINADNHDLVHHEAQEATCTTIGWNAYDTCSRCEYSTYEEIKALGHDIVHHEAQEATCTEIGWNAYDTCSRCDYTTYEEIKALGHDLVHHDAKEATCTEIGWNAYDTCSRCDYTTYEEIKALGHDFIHHEAKEATCLEIGWNAYDTCSRCDYTTYEEIKALGHDLIHHEAQEATCTEIGWNAYDTCSRCDYSTYEEIKALGHDLVHHEAQEATCTEIGWNAYDTCSRCDYTTYEEIKALGHDLVHHEAQETTCTTIGWNAYDTCSRCDYSTYEEIKALGHDLVHHEAQEATCTEIGWNAYDTCSRCEYSTYEEIKALGHDLVHHEAHEATCTEIGWNAYDTCSRCDYSTYEEIKALGHDFVHHEAKEATCTEIGWNAYDTCSRCDYTTYEEIKALGHDLVHHEAQEATCTTIGWNAYDTCSRCDYTTYEEIKALGHELVHHEAKEATCTTIGWNAYDTCSRCEYSTYEEIKALGHDLIHHEAKEATCTTIGWNAYDTCSRCEYTTYEEIKALGHDLIHHDAKEATCTEIGWNAYDTCSRCSYTTYVEIPALNHDFIHHEAKEATCTEIGWNAYDTCSRCSYTTYVEIPALNHDFIHHEAKAPTCTEIGWNAYDTCSRCSYTTYVEIPALNHDLVHHEAKSATCTEIGWYAYDTCSRCEYSAYVEIPALNHDLVHHDAKTPTCTEIGWSAYDTCSRCEYSTYEEIKALGHTFSEWETIQAPTCQEKGSHKRTCSSCQLVEIEELDKTAHTLSSAVEENRVEATYFATGSYDSVIYCSVCGEELSRENVIIPIIEAQKVTLTEANHDAILLDGAYNMTIEGYLFEFLFDGQIYADDGIVLYLNVTIKFTGTSGTAQLWLIDKANDDSEGTIYLTYGGLGISFELSEVNEIKDKLIETARKFQSTIGLEEMSNIDDFNLNTILDENFFGILIDMSIADEVSYYFTGVSDIVDYDETEVSLSSSWDCGHLNARLATNVDCVPLDTSYTFLNKQNLFAVCDDAMGVCEISNRDVFNLNIDFDVYEPDEITQEDVLKYTIEGVFQIKLFADRSIDELYAKIEAVAQDGDDSLYFEAYLKDDVAYLKLSYYPFDSDSEKFKPLYIKAGRNDIDQLVEIVRTTLNVDIDISGLTDGISGLVEEELNEHSDGDIVLNVQDYFKQFIDENNQLSVLINGQKLYSHDVQDIIFGACRDENNIINKLYAKGVTVDTATEMYFSGEVELLTSDFEVPTPPDGAMDLSSIGTLANVVFDSFVDIEDNKLSLKDKYYFAGEITFDFSIGTFSPEITICFDPVNFIATLTLAYERNAILNEGAFKTYITLDIKNQLVYMMRYDQSRYLKRLKWVYQDNWTYRSMTMDEFLGDMANQLGYIINASSSLQAILNSTVESGTATNPPESSEESGSGETSVRQPDDFGTYFTGYSYADNTFSLVVDGAQISSSLGDIYVTIPHDVNYHVSSISANITIGIEISINLAYENTTKPNGDYSLSYADLKEYWISTGAVTGSNFVMKTGVTSSQSSVNNIVTYLERAKELVDKFDDNCGTAKLLIDYCSFIYPAEDLPMSTETINKNEEYAQKDASSEKGNFPNELEFAQANGQIDNSTEYTKEMYLQVINNWYDWAQDTGNYGFFRKVLKAYLDQIQKSAEKRGIVLLGQLEEISKSADRMQSVEKKEQKIAKIKSMITEQKYTAAEDLLNRFWVEEEDNDPFFEKDILEDFLSNYENYYQYVSSHQSSFSVLASKRGYGYNKETRQARDLAENWLPGGSDLGPIKLKVLLNLLGFKVRKIDVQPRISIGKTTYENYFVYTEAIRKYSHPIAAFGTSAAVDGFRIVCMTGIYTTDQLISVMEVIGNAKHTLVLLDDALSIGERRRLARKTKNKSSDKFIGVLDRVVMMYIVRNFDQTHNNRMLLSLVAPFGYYQPYVWDSACPMPPELFIGRKKELEAIESRSGVNIVYGGRQLGKSALLKKAKDDIDKDENGDRAVFIDIKYKTYANAAQIIGHALFDCGILTEDIDTTDWDALSRCIKRRLQSDQNPIPYLLLLLDEADTFIESSEAIKYAPFDALKDIQGTGKFKFVVAGLHNVVRFKREVALGNNSVLAHFEAITVKPFSFLEAQELLEVPLHYLGFRFPRGNDSEFLIPTILSSANYFPGLIQMYCAKLLQAMRENNYAGYDEVNSPIYEVSAEHIKKILADENFIKAIREKFEIKPYFRLVSFTSDKIK